MKIPFGYLLAACLYTLLPVCVHGQCYYFAEVQDLQRSDSSISRKVYFTQLASSASCIDEAEVFRHVRLAWFHLTRNPNLSAGQVRILGPFRDEDFAMQQYIEHIGAVDDAPDKHLLTLSLP
ncbi:MAG: hypothetical protein ACK5QE_03615 [Sphingobacteriia bacterium]|jgi:hypothetical protein